MQAPVAQPVSEPLDAEARRVLNGVQRAVSAVVAALPRPVRKPNDLMHVLGVSKTLAWRIGNLVRQDDPLAIMGFLPRDGAMEVFLEAAGRQGVAPAMLESVREAVASVDELAERHAGDRASLAMMVQGHRGPAEEQTALSHRRAAFHGNSFVYGVQARAKYLSLYFAPTVGRPGFVDQATCTGFYRFRRMRPGVQWCIGQAGFYHTESGWAEGEPRREPLDPLGTGSVAYLRDFSSSPPPEIQVTEAQPGVRLLELVGGMVGNAGATTWFLGERFLGLDVRETEPGSKADHFGGITHVRTPCEVLVFDLLMHHSFFGDRIPRADFYGAMDFSGSTPRVGPANRLPMNLRVESLGRGALAARSPDVPRTEEMAAHVFDRIGWKGEEFSVFRLRVEYPPIPTVAVLMYET